MFIETKVQGRFYGDFFGDFSVIKAHKLHQTRCKTCHSMNLRMEVWELTAVTATWSRGPESAIMDKSREPKSRGTNLHLWRFCAHVRRECNLFCLISPHTPFNVENYYLQFLLISRQHCIWGKGKSNPSLQGKAVKLQITQGLLCTIVWCSRLMEKCTISMFF